MFAWRLPFIFIVIAGAGLVSTQSYVKFTYMMAHALTHVQSMLDIPLSSSCLSTLRGLLTSCDAACLNPPSLLPLIVGSEQSIPDTINTWMTGLCASGSCADESLVAIVSTVTRGCNQDLINARMDVQGIQDKVSEMLKKAYPNVRKIMCLKEFVF
jgi:hypothetical protein